MVVTVTLPHLQRAASGRWEYRRRVPERLKAFAGKGTWKRVLKAEEGKALLREHARVEADHDRDMKEAEAKRRRSVAASSGPASPRALWEEAKRWAEEQLTGVHGLDEDDARDVLAEMVAAPYAVDPEDGNPMWLTPLDTMRVKALRRPDAAPPPPTLKDARDAYVKERLKGGTPQEDGKTVERVDRMVREVEAALGTVPVLADLKIADARRVLAHMKAVRKQHDKGSLKLSTIKRNMNTLKAVVTFGATEFDLPATFRNPFRGLDLGDDEAAAPEGEARDPLPLAVLASVRDRILTSGTKGALPLIWRILQGTGCRLAEVTGLRAQDVFLEAECPHIKVAWHEDRRIKTKTSRRHVPLVGDALGPVREPGWWI